MVLLIVLAVVIALTCIWWISRPLRLAPVARPATETAELEILRDRLLVQLRDLESERADRSVDATVAQSEERRLSAELADVLRRLETERTTGMVASGPSLLSSRSVLTMTLILAALVLFAGGGLYLVQNGGKLHGFALAARSGSAAGTLPPMVFEMVAKLEKRLEQNPNDAAGWARLGRSYVVLKQLDRAREAYGRAHELAPESAEILSDYAWLVFTSSPGDTTGLANTLYTRLMKLDPDNADALWFMGMAAYQRGDTREAVKVWTRLERHLKAGSPEAAELRKLIRTARERGAGQKSQR